jgi:tRNA (mo5U34)-methyltransferase
MLYNSLLEKIQDFSSKLDEIKSENLGFPWYPYGTLNNFYHLQPLITSEIDEMFSGGKRIADIGAADGDLAFFLESLGHQVDIYDHPPTNMNGLRGATRLKEVLKSAVNVYDVDLDSQMKLHKNYDLIVLLGILYHLKNPFYVLETLARSTKHLIVSTRIARRFHEQGPDMSSMPVAYLLSPTESNNDATNYWIFTDQGLKRIIDRAGWNVVAYRTVGDLLDSNPQQADHDERAFAILRSRHV